jgi:hypothetical protein
MSEFGLAMIGPKASYALAASIAFASRCCAFSNGWCRSCASASTSPRGALGKRLKHVERELAGDAQGAVPAAQPHGRRYPADPVLGEVAKILGEAWPVDRETRPAEQDLIDKPRWRGSMPLLLERIHEIGTRAWVRFVQALNWIMPSRSPGAWSWSTPPIPA